VYNPTLVTNFIGTYKILYTRSSNRLFSQRGWMQYDDVERRTKAFSYYLQICSKFSWNKNSAVPILPLCHGTDQHLAEKICETGFATLSSLDAGYFGKGIYFTSDSIYTLPYISQKKKPYNYHQLGRPRACVPSHWTTSIRRITSWLCNQIWL